MASSLQDLQREWAAAQAHEQAQQASRAADAPAPSFQEGELAATERSASSGAPRAPTKHA